MHNPPVSHVAQRLVDPEICSACFGCFEVCPTGAVVVRNRQVAIDPALCNDCKACVAECSTDAINVIRMVPDNAAYGIEEQFNWDKLPAEEF